MNLSIEAWEIAKGVLQEFSDEDRLFIIKEFTNYSEILDTDGWQEKFLSQLIEFKNNSSENLYC